MSSTVLPGRCHRLCARRVPHSRPNSVFLGISALVASASTDRRSRPLALALVLWFLAVVLYDVAALGLASLLPSGAASRLLILAVVLNPADAARTAMLLGIEGTAAFGAASLAFLRFTRGPVNALLLLALSLALWMVLPAALSSCRLKKADL